MNNPAQTCACHGAHDCGAAARHIYVYSPSGAVRDRAAFARAVRRLEKMGHTVEVDADALRSHQRFAGDDATRLAALHRAADSGAHVALISRGGYGLTRILGGIDYERIARAVQRGTQFVGFSDFTALQNALLARLGADARGNPGAADASSGALTWAGPALVADFGSVLPSDEIMLDCFADLLCHRGEGSGWRLPLQRRRTSKAMGGAAQRTLEPAPEAEEAPSHDAQGFETPADSLLWGGNLSVLVSLLGTPYFPAVREGILFLEDVGEHPYRIERMLTQLLHAGVLAQQRAVLLGAFTECRRSPHDRGFGLESVVQHLRTQLPCPVLRGLPFGHVPTKVLLPVGARTALSVQGRDALLYWGHLS